MKTSRKKPKPKVFRDTQKELNTLIEYQLKDLDFWPKMIRKRARALKKTFGEGFDGTVSRNTVTYFQKIQKDINEISKNFKEIHGLLGEIMSEHDTDKVSADISWRDERWKVAAGRSYDIITEEGEVIGESVPDRILRAWLKKNKRSVRLRLESPPSGRKSGTVHVMISGPYSDVPGGRYAPGTEEGVALHKGQRGKKKQRGKKDPYTKPDPEKLKDELMDSLPYRVMQKWWQKQDDLEELAESLKEEKEEKRQKVLEDAFDWQGHAKDFVGDFKHRLKDGADPAWFVDDLAKAMKEDDPEGALKRMSAGQVAGELYDAVLKEMKRQRVPVL